MKSVMKGVTLEKMASYVAFFCGLYVLLPFKVKPLIVFVFFIWSLFYIRKNEIKKKVNLKTLVLASTFFLIYAVSLLFSENIQKGITVLVRCIPIVAIPLGYLFLTHDARIQFNQIFKKTFIIAASIYSCLVYFYLFQLGYFSQKHDLFYCYSFITYEFWGFNEHPIYLSLFFSVALFFILMQGFKSKIANAILFLIIISGLLILARKGVIVAFFVLAGVFVVCTSDRKQTLRLVLIFSTLFLLSLSVAEIRGRFLEVFDSSKVINNKETSSGIRYILWSTSQKAIENSNYLGVGVGDVQKVLSHELARDGYTVLAKENYNAHNQYLQIGIATGIFGIVLYVLSLGCILLDFIKKQNIEAVIMLLFFMLTFLFESVLERQNGIILYSFVICMQLYTSKCGKRTLQ
ncbi:O-antigen ligase family protein [Flavobacterium sp. K77]|uniref:O-antigen ligase family protein n=1 Tax=Flavobacterium sp. K77 TaxID=2910676 RepID=UPI001F3C6174|nr:O-antigen ligase family protein [Flavobacterium sp. K77]MCF6139760.1 O-antigen ligase family protein [Flavobacterium sp. K77]